ncbi:hypothetical protein [Enterococcus hirae]|nr:hypothetical protein [Enterococcus hirae]EMF0041075.1 hypothetical protein [Enterococcus hirae]MCR1912991.1 hypothetical protein [Enterococcus hirae]MDL4888712.1 hypothetical protein [Enterococcus hirae]MDL4891280.1 hypothetical protein [Enterococcus hirae]MDL4897476.1 hypothetical protein [Enterococcus hirae]
MATKEIGTLNGNKYWEWAGYESRMEWSAIFVTWVAEQRYRLKMLKRE